MTTGRARLPFGLLSAVLLLIAVEAAVERFALDTVGPVAWQYRFARRTAAAKAADSEVLAFGDSLLKYAFLPAVLERRHGVRAYNLAVCGGRVPYHYYLLRRVLEGGAKPTAVLIEFFPGSLSEGPRPNAGELPHFLRAGECFELGDSARDPGLLGSLVAGWLLPSVRGREAIRTVLTDLARRKPRSTRYENTWLLPWWSKNRGAQPMHAQPGSPGDVAVVQQTAFPASWSSDRVNDLYLGRFLDLAARHGTTVYWVLTPLSPPLQAACERSGFDARFVAYVKRWQGRYPNLNVIDGRHAGYDPAVYHGDPAHLGKAGAFVFSTDLGGLLRGPGSDAGRWVTMPRFRPLTPDADIEDDLAARRTAAARGRGFVNRF